VDTWLVIPEGSTWRGVLDNKRATGRSQGDNLRSSTKYINIHMSSLHTNHPLTSGQWCSLNAHTQPLDRFNCRVSYMRCFLLDYYVLYVILNLGLSGIYTGDLDICCMALQGCYWASSLKTCLADHENITSTWRAFYYNVMA